MSTISAGTTVGTALVNTGDTTGELVLKTNGSTTAVTIDTAQRVAFVAGTAALPAITTAGDTNTGIFFPAADSIGFAEGGAEVARFDSSGNLGIGTSSPAAKLHVANASGSIQARVSSDTDVSVAAIASGSDSTAFMTVINDARQWTMRVNGAESDQFQIRDSTAGATRVTLDSSGNLGFNSGYGSVATAYGCRAWVNFNGTGTVAIRASGNVSSITDNGTGTYTANFTTALPDGNYATEVFCNVNINALGYGMLITNAPTTTSVSVRTFNQSLAATDCEFVNIAVFR